MMSDSIKTLLIEKMDMFIEEIEPLLDGEFVKGENTAVLFTEAVETVWNAMGYAARLESTLDE